MRVRNVCSRAAHAPLRSCTTLLLAADYTEVEYRKAVRTGSAGPGMVTTASGSWTL